MTERLRGKGAVVTGAGRGIGREVALALAAEGANVVAVDPGGARDGLGTDLAPADQVVAEITKAGGTAISSFESVADYDAAGRIIQSCVEHFEQLDILVNCAGILRERMIFNMSPEEFDAVVKVHLYGTWNCMRHASVLMRGQKSGCIVNFTSDAWRGGGIGQCNYSASKGAIVSLTYTVARELGRYGVMVNAIAPVAATRMTLDEGVKAGMQKRYEAGLITKENLDNFLAMPGPEFIAPMVAYLATDAAADINGQVFHVEKGKISIYTMPEPMNEISKEEAGGMFTIDDIEALAPTNLLNGYVNPAPRKTELISEKK
jgi:NAD(P)-dependent dehydrogenase (short-subunit alcohol dehydrogenase family)